MSTTPEMNKNKQNNKINQPTKTQINQKETSPNFYLGCYLKFTIKLCVCLLVV